AEKERLRAYADRFNARDFDALRGLLAEDVRLEMVNRRRLAGREEVSPYFTRYGDISGWRVEPCRAEGRAALLVGDAEVGASGYVILLDWRDGQIAKIRDFRFASYVMDALALSTL
ncbi:MAG TPA: nuclear transport factor 2 family protein, partial [Roseiarcus sp.]|nr:nuclear transport factor 2 family protein [Roseiarcus sp.]